MGSIVTGELGVRRWRGATRIMATTLAGLLVAACGSEKVYEGAFSQKAALQGNSRKYDASAERTFRAAKIALVQQGFAITQADPVAGLLNGKRTYDDPKDKKIAYLISATVDVTALAEAQTAVTVSASQQTAYHQKKKQTVIRSEGDITGAAFYNDMFTAIARSMPPVIVAVPVALPPPAAAPAPLAPAAPPAPPAPPDAPAPVADATAPVADPPPARPTP